MTIRELTRMHKDSIEVTMLITKIVSDIAYAMKRKDYAEITKEVIKSLEEMQDEIIQQEGLIK